MVPTTSTMMLFLSMLSGNIEVVDANTFLGPRQEGDLVFETALLADLEGALGSTHRAAADSRLEGLETLIKPLFVAMPKDGKGRLGHATVRYVLHRLFMEKHGWFVKGLEPAGEAFNSSSPTDILKDRVGEHVQGFFEDRLGAHGFGIHEIAVLAATLENLVHEEAVDRLSGAYTGAGLILEGKASDLEMDTAIDTYMAIYIMGKNHSLMTPAEIQFTLSSIHLSYPTWPETQKFVRGVRQEVLGKREGNAAFSFDETTEVVEKIGDRYGRWQDSECKDLKNSLIKMEDQGTGRVLLKDFYASALAGQWQFGESASYLRQLGALDESNPEHPSVIISNYVNSPSNCLSSSRFYAVCCLDECEPLLSKVEHEIAAPDSSPERIAEVIMAISSATVEAPRSLPSSLRGRLDEIAKHHGGTVPLHGRLFGQWMHHAYPRECPYPHVSGTTRPLSADEWMIQTGTDAAADEDEMLQHVEKPSRVTDAEELPWTIEEELFVIRPQLTERAAVHPAWAMSQGVFFVGALVSLALSVGRTLPASIYREVPQKIYI